MLVMTFLLCVYSLFFTNRDTGMRSDSINIAAIDHHLFGMVHKYNATKPTNVPKTKVSYRQIVTEAKIQRVLYHKDTSHEGKIHTGNTSLETTSPETFYNKSQEVRHIAFLKVHKAASSTMQNIFFRFGAQRNLTFVFTSHPNYFSRSTRNHIPLVPPRWRPGARYDILCNHGVFNKKVYTSLLPKDAVYLAIVRDPLDVFISGVNFYTQASQMMPYLRTIPENKLLNLIRYPLKYDPVLSYTRNVMARDFGFDFGSDDNMIQNKLDELGSVFKLVLIVEYFDESLVLMKRYLSWKMNDILYLPNNVHTRSVYSKKHLLPSDMTKFRDRNTLDYKVYHYFLSKFRRQFHTEDADIHNEVLSFKRTINLLNMFCNGNSQSSALVVEATPWNERFTVTSHNCSDMALNELAFIRRLRAAQGSELRSDQRPVGRKKFRRGPMRRSSN